MAQDFGTSLGSSLVSDIVKFVSAAIKPHIFYVLKCQSYLDDLVDKREKVQLTVDHIIRQGVEIHESAEQWLTDVDGLFQRVANYEGQAKTRCFKGFCSNLKTRYKIGRKAAKLAANASNQLGITFSDFSYPTRLQRTKSLYVRDDYENFDSRESILQEIMEALKDANVNRIGVYGMGGVGKTTLVKKIAWEVIEDKLFDDVVVVEVTQNPDNRKIREKIACDLGLEFVEHETEFNRAKRLRDRLKQRKRRVLIILDNVWAKPDFEAIGIPLADDGINEEDSKEKNDDDKRAYKILLTSRKLDVLRNDMNVHKYFHVNILSADDAEILFWKIVDKHRSAESKTDSGIGAEIVKKCAGLPLAIATIANALKHKSLQAWEEASSKLTAANTRNIQGMDERVVSVIELSFNLLQSDEAKKLFLLCSLVDSGHDISRDYLLRYGMGWGLFEGTYTLEDGKKRLCELINILKTSCLLLEGDTNDWVKMHEFIHAVAISIAARSNLFLNIQHVPYLDKVLEEKISKEPTAISLPRGDICEVPEKLGCPTLELFFLFMKSPSLQIPDSFFEGMNKLKVVDLDSVNLLSLPSSFHYLTKLRTLCLDGCQLGDVSAIGELKNLEILSFSRSNIEELPGGIGQLTRLQLLDLSYCSSLRVIPANVISRLSRLEELYLDRSFSQWENGLNNEDGSNANLSELIQLSRLTTLNLCIRDAQIITPDLFEQEFKRFRILIGDVWNWSHRIEASTTLKLKLSNRSYLGYMPIKRLLKRTEDLHLDGWTDNQNFFYELGMEISSSLKYLHTQNCPQLRYLVNSVKRVAYNAFPMLEILSLTNLIKLEKICHGPLQDQSFKKLRTIKVHKCDGLKHLFSVSMAKRLSELQEIEVTDCRNLEGIFSEGVDEGRAGDANGTNNKVEFSQLRSLILQRLPQFTNFSFTMKTNTPSTEISTSDDHEDYNSFFGESVEFPKLENLTLSSIGIERIWPGQVLSLASCCQTVKSLTLEDCNGLNFCFSPSMVKSFAQLQRLVLRNCKSMEQVLDAKGLQGEKSIRFPKLFYLEFKDLPKLTRFGNENIIEFPSLNVLIIENCPTFADMITSNEPESENQPLSINMKNPLATSWQNLTIIKIHGCDNWRYLFPSCMFKSLVQLQSLTVTKCMSLEMVIDVRMSEMMTFPRLNSLRLEDLQSLKMFCNCTGNLIKFPLLSNLFIDKCTGLESFTSHAISAIADGPEENHHDNMQSLFDELVSLPHLEKLIVRKMDNLRRIWANNLLNLDSFSKLHEIRVGHCNKLLNIFPSFMRERLQSLEVLKVWHCKSVEEIFDFQALSGRETDVIIATQLRVLQLHHLPNLKYAYDMHNRETIWDDDQLNVDSFSKLCDVRVGYCDKLLNIFPSIIHGRLQSLSVLMVWNCASVEEIFKLQALGSQETNAIIAIQLRELQISHLPNLKRVCSMQKEEEVEAVQMFCRLTSLTLIKLPRLRCFYSGMHFSEWPMLKHLVVDSCTTVETLASEFLNHQENHKESQHPLFFVDKVAFPRLEELELSKLPELLHLWKENSQSSKAFQNLATLKVSKCHKLMNIVPSSVSFQNLTALEVSKCDSLISLVRFKTVGSLSQLTTLDISDCKRLEQIITVIDLGNEVRDKIVFKELNYLRLKRLPSLGNFCSGIRTIEFPSLDPAIARKYSKMKS